MDEEIKKTYFSHRRLPRNNMYRLEGILALKENQTPVCNKIKRSINMINKYELKIKRNKRNPLRARRRNVRKAINLNLKEFSSGLNSPASVPSDYKYDSNNESNSNFLAILDLWQFSLSDNEETANKNTDVFLSQEKEPILNKSKDLNEEDQITKDLKKLNLLN